MDMTPTTERPVPYVSIEIPSSVPRLGTAMADAFDRYPIPWIDWNVAQWQWLSDPHPRKLLRAGNQSIGKTWAGLAEVHWRCTGTHPCYRTHEPPIEAWIICTSWAQSVAVQSKFYYLCDKDALDPSTEFDPGRGFRGQHPIVRYKNGSIVRFKTAQQGGLNLASATIHYVHIDEPTTARIYTELSKRVARTNGAIGITLTPINGPVEWLRELVEAEGDIIHDHHFRLEERHLIGHDTGEPMRLDDGTPMDDDWIAAMVRETPSTEVPVVIHGEWEQRVEGRYFDAFDPAAHVDGFALPSGVVKIALGIDHGDGTNHSQCAVLMAVDEDGEHPKVWILDEYVSDGHSTPDMDADGILAMLRRNGMGWESVDYAMGDRVHYGRKGGLSKKSNADLHKWIARRLKVPGSKCRPMIRTAKRGQGRGRGAVSEGCRFLHHAMVRPGHFYVSPRCTRWIESAEKWDYRDNEWKHIFDATRYGLDRWIFARRPAAPVVPIRRG